MIPKIMRILAALLFIVGQIYIWLGFIPISDFRGFVDMWSPQGIFIAVFLIIPCALLAWGADKVESWLNQRDIDYVQKVNKLKGKHKI